MTWARMQGRMGRVLCGALLSVLLTACGGGGGGGGSGSTAVASTLTFALRAAFNTLVTNGETRNAVAVGTAATSATDGHCSGTFINVDNPANVAATFEGQPALASAGASTLTLTNCVPASTVVNGTTFYSLGYLPMGEITSGASPHYLVAVGTPNIPNTTTVGTVITMGSYNRYTDSTKATPSGRSDHSLVIEADTATTAIVNHKVLSYNASNVLQTQEQTRYRLTSAGVLTYVSTDAQAYTGSGIRLVFRAP